MREKIENILIERVLNRQYKTNEKILKEIGEVLGMTGEIRSSDLYKVKQQLKYDEKLEKILKILEENSKITSKEISDMFEERAKTDYEFAEQYYNARGEKQLPYDENIPLKNKVDEIARATFDEFFEISTYSNVSHTTGLTFLDIDGNQVTKGISDAYKQIVDDAIINVRMGKESFDVALANQLKTIGQNGVQQIEYASGHHRRIDSALRMNLQEGLTRLSMAQQEIVGKQFGADGVEITVHDNPAPDHAPLQGHIFEKEEFKKLQSGSLAKDVDGNSFQIDRAIGQWNCYHDVFEIVLGVSTPRYSKKELETIIKKNEKGFTYENKHYTMYEATQKQRQLETEIRRARETQIMQKASLNQLTNQDDFLKLNSDLDKTKERINNLLSKYHSFSKESGLPTQLERTRLLTNK